MVWNESNHFRRTEVVKVEINVIFPKLTRKDIISVVNSMSFSPSPPEIKQTRKSQTHCILSLLFTLIYLLSELLYIYPILNLTHT